METQHSLPPHYHLRLCHTGLPYSNHGVCSMESTCWGSSEWQTLTAGTHTMSTTAALGTDYQDVIKARGALKVIRGTPMCRRPSENSSVGVWGWGRGWLGQKGRRTGLAEHAQTPLATTSWDTRVQEGSLLLRLIARGSPTLPHHSLPPTGLS